MAPDTCVIAVTLRHVVTKVERRPGIVLRASDFPPEAHYEIPALSAIFGVSRRRIWNLLSEWRSCFDPPQYRLKFRRRHRVINRHDFYVLEQIFRSPVKPFHS